jgi:hypothetical protein
MNIEKLMKTTNQIHIIYIYITTCASINTSANQNAWVYGCKSNATHDTTKKLVS